MTAASATRRMRRPTVRDAAADRSREEILVAATEEFAAYGLSGARVDAIAERTATSKGMIYYHFGSKEGLYVAVLDRIYADIRHAEAGLELDALSPVDALRRYVEHSFDFHADHPHFSRIISFENINDARYVRMCEGIGARNHSVIDTLGTLIARGLASDDFRNPIAAVDLHYVISSLTVYRIANGRTFGAIFGCDFADPATRERQKRLAVTTVLALLAAQPQ